MCEPSQRNTTTCCQALEAYELAHYHQCLDTEALRKENTLLREHNLRLQQQVAALQRPVDDARVKVESTVWSCLAHRDLQLQEARLEIEERNQEIRRLSCHNTASEESIKHAERLHSARVFDLSLQRQEELEERSAQLAAAQTELVAVLGLLAEERALTAALRDQMHAAATEMASLRQRVHTFLSLEVSRCCSSPGPFATQPPGFLCITASDIAKRAADTAPLDSLMTAISSLPLDGRLFEQLICELFRQRGARVSHCGQANDGGIDFVLTVPQPGRAGAAKRVVGQCKLYRCKVGTSTVREFCGAMLASHCPNGILVCSSAFSRAAWELVAALRNQHGLDIDLWDSDRIRVEAVAAAPQLLAFLAAGGAAFPNSFSLPSEAADAIIDENIIDRCIKSLLLSADDPQESTDCHEEPHIPSSTYREKVNETNVNKFIPASTAQPLAVDCFFHASSDVWSAEEVEALKALVKRFRESSTNSPAGKTPGRIRSDGQGRIPWAVICGHIKAEGQRSVFHSSHITKERLRSKWKNMGGK